jgi:hypothetical protein
MFDEARRKTMIGTTRMVVAMALGFALVAEGTSGQQGELVLGVELGPSLTKMEGITIRDAGSEWGFSAGLFAEYRASALFSVPVGVTWTQKGGSGETAAGVPFELGSSYLEIPVMLNLTVPYGDSQRLGFYGGVAVGFQLSCDVTREGETVECGETEIFDTDPESVEWSIPFGIEYDFQLANGHFLGLDLRYTYGLSDIMTSSTVELMNRGWQFLVSWGVPIRGG